MTTKNTNTNRHRLAVTVKHNPHYSTGGPKTKQGPYHNANPGIAKGGVDYTGHGPQDSDKSHPIEDLGTFESTAYGPPWDAMNGTGTTAGGTDLSSGKQAYIVAVDPDVIPLGTYLEIKPNPFGTTHPFLADDTGGAIQGKRIDFYDWRGRKAQMDWGRKTVHVWALKGYRGTGIPGTDAASNAYNAAKGAVDSVGGALSDIAAGIRRLFDSDFWVRSGKGILGAVALLMGVVIFGRAILGIDIPDYAARLGRGTRARWADRGLGDMTPPSPAERLRGRKALDLHKPLGDDIPF